MSVECFYLFKKCNENGKSQKEIQKAVEILDVRKEVLRIFKRFFGIRMMIP